MSYRFNISLKNVSTREQLHSLLSDILPLPEWYGGNLDALYDSLTDPSFCEGNDGEIELADTGGFKAQMPRYYYALQQMCRGAQEERDGLVITLGETDDPDQSGLHSQGK